MDGKSDTQFDKILKIKSYLEKTGLSINAPSSYIYDVIIDIITQRTENKSIPLFVEDIRKIDSRILYFPTYRRVEKDLQNLINAIKKEREDDDDMGRLFHQIAISQVDRELLPLRRSNAFRIRQYTISDHVETAGILTGS